MSAKFLLMSESGIDFLLGRRQIRSAALQEEEIPGIYSRRLDENITGLATGRETGDEYLALISVSVLESLASNFETIFSRISRVLKSAVRPPIHLPRSWAEFHFKNRLTFFAVPESEGKARWLAEIDGGSRVIRFLDFTDSNRKQNLDTWQPAEVVDRSAEFWLWAASLKEQVSAHPLEASFAEQVDLKVIGSEAVVQGYSLDDWMPKLKADQRRIVESDPSVSMRVIGPAGSGKTLTLCIRAMRLARLPEVIGARKKILIVTHSWAMTERIDGILRSLGDGQVPASISVLPLLYVLQAHAGSISQISGSVLGDDSAEGQRIVLELIESIIQEPSLRVSETLRSRMSPYMQRALSPTATAHVKTDLVIDLYEEIVGVLSPQGIWPSEGDKVAEYLVADRDEEMPPFSAKADREYCIRVFDRLLELLVDLGAITTDQLVLDCIRVFETFSWNVKRETDGYDYILVDELQLFDSQDRLAVSLLSRSKPGMVFLSVEDPSQGLFSAINDRSPSLKSSNSIYLEEAHRFRAGLFEFISFLYSQFPLNATPIRAAVSDSKVRKPRLTQLSSRVDAVEWSVEKAKELHGAVEKGRRVCVVCVGPLEAEIFASLQRAGVPAVLLRSFDDVELLSYQRKTVVVSPWQFIGGTQFTDVILVTAGLNRPATAHARLRELTAIYLGASRASSSLDIATDARIPEVLQAAARDRFLTKNVVIGGAKAHPR